MKRYENPYVFLDEDSESDYYTRLRDLYSVLDSFRYYVRNSPPPTLETYNKMRSAIKDLEIQINALEGYIQ